MTIEQLKDLDGNIITLEELEAVEEFENVVSTEDNGLSGLHYNKHWYSVTLSNGEEIQVYTN